MQKHNNPNDRKEKKYINNLLKNKLIDFIASDVHNNNTRSSNLRKAYDHLKGKINDQYLEEIFYNNAKKLLTVNKENKTAPF